MRAGATQVTGAGKLLRRLKYCPHADCCGPEAGLIFGLPSSLDSLDIRTRLLMQRNGRPQHAWRLVRGFD
eukprot:360038-Chlamydomonas_euryale.AAC.3